MAEPTSPHLDLRSAWYGEPPVPIPPQEAQAPIASSLSDALVDFFEDQNTDFDALVASDDVKDKWPWVGYLTQLKLNVTEFFRHIGKHCKHTIASHLFHRIPTLALMNWLPPDKRVYIEQNQEAHLNYEHDMFTTDYSPGTSHTTIDEIEMAAMIWWCTEYFDVKSGDVIERYYRHQSKHTVYMVYRFGFRGGKVTIAG